jgi:hypothetical protein
MNAWQTALAGLCAAPGVVLGLVLVVRRQRVVGALLVLLGAMPLLLLSPESTAPGSTSHGADLVLEVMRVAGWVWFYVPPALLAACFPDGRVGRRWWWLPVGWAVFVVLFHVAVAVDPESYGSGEDKIAGTPPIEVSPWLNQALGFGSLALLLALLVGSAARIIVRYRRGDDVLRRQVKWVAMSVVLLPIVLVVTWLAYLLTDVAGVVVVAGLLLVFVSVPVSVAIAVLRHDLYDIDRLFSQTVGYLVLSGLLVAVFAVTTVAVGVVVGGGSDPAIAIGTLGAAVAFGLLRRRLQSRVDSRFDRDRRDALREVSRFVGAVRDGSAEPEALEASLRRALRDPALTVAYSPPTRRLRGATARAGRPSGLTGSSSMLRSAGGWSVRSRTPRRAAVPRCCGRCCARPTFPSSWRTRASSSDTPSPRPKRPAPGWSKPRTPNAAGSSAISTTVHSSSSSESGCRSAWRNDGPTPTTRCSRC